MKKRTILGITTITLICATVFVSLIVYAQKRRTGTINQTRPRRVSAEVGRAGQPRLLNPTTTAELQAAINSAKYGDTIVLQAGRKYETAEPLVFPNKGEGTGSDEDYITLRTSDLIGIGEGARITPNQAKSMPKLITKNANPVINFKWNANHYRFVGIEMTNTLNSNQFTNHLVSADYPDVGQFPHHLVFDRCFLHSIEDTTGGDTTYSSLGGGIAVEGSEITVMNSWISGFGHKYPSDRTTPQVSIAIAMGAGPGPYRVINNYLESWYVNVFIGGSDPVTPNHGVVLGNPAPTLTSATLNTTANLNVGDYIGFAQPPGNPTTDYGCGRVLTKTGNSITFTPLEVSNGRNNRQLGKPPLVGGDVRWNGVLPTDIEIRRNTFYKRPEWNTLNGKTAPSYGKGYMEIKIARNVVIDGNIFDGTPTSLTITTRNQGGKAPWSTIRNVTVSNNWFKKFASPISAALDDSQRISTPGGDIFIFNNLFTNPGTHKEMTADYFASIVRNADGGDNVQFYHNTAFQNGVMFEQAGAIRRFVWRDNVTLFGDDDGLGCVGAARSDGTCDLVRQRPPQGYRCRDIGSQRFRDCFPEADLRGNVIVMDRRLLAGTTSDLPSRTNFFPSSIEQVGFVNYLGGDYRLAVNSPYKGKATDGTDPGVDMDKLLLAIGITK